jgi:hypothetical protein
MNIESIELNAGPGFATITPKMILKNTEVAEVMELLKSGDFLEAHKTLVAIRKTVEANHCDWPVRLAVIQRTLESYFRTPAKKCLVKGCENYSHQGQFVGDLCAPCHTMITTGKVSQGGGWIGDNVRWKEQIVQVIHGEMD